MILYSSPRFAEHTTPPGHPEGPERAGVFDATAAAFAKGGGVIRPPRAATEDELARVHRADYLDDLRKTAGRAVMLDPDTFTSPESLEIALLAAGAAVDAAREAYESPHRNVRFGAASRPSCRGRPRHGLLPVQQHRGCGNDAASNRRRARGDRGHRRPPWQRDAELVLRRPDRAVHLEPPVSVLSRHRRRARNRCGSRTWCDAQRSAGRGRDRRRLSQGATKAK